MNVLNTITECMNESDAVSDSDILKRGIKEEETAVALYTKMMSDTKCDRVKKLLEHVIKDEQHHADEFRKLLKIKSEEIDD